MADRTWRAVLVAFVLSSTTRLVHGRAQAPDSLEDAHFFPPSEAPVRRDDWHAPPPSRRGTFGGEQHARHLATPLRGRICYECANERTYPCKDEADFRWVDCDTDCIKIDGRILSERYLPGRTRADVSAVEGHFRGCFSDALWSDYLELVRRDTCTTFNHTGLYPFVSGTVCRCSTAYCNEGTTRRTGKTLFLLLLAAYLVALA